jgi:hypothetical protein
LLPDINALSLLLPLLSDNAEIIPFPSALHNNKLSFMPPKKCPSYYQFSTLLEKLIGITMGQFSFHITTTAQGFGFPLLFCKLSTNLFAELPQNT